MTPTVAVVGLGAAGSATAAHLAERGVRVIGFDRFTPPHAQGSSHGETRIIREAYFEHPLYVPLVQRAYALWDILAARTATPLFRRTGGLMMGPPESDVVRGALESAATHRLPHELLDARMLRQRHPAFALPEDQVAVFEPRAGILAPESAIAAQLAVARAAGATLRLGEPVIGWTASATGGVRVRTADGETRADHLVLAAGPWTSGLLGHLRLPLTVERNVVHWFASRQPERVSALAMPIFIHESSVGRAWYGFPDVGAGVKLALHHQGLETTADAVDREVGEQEVAAVRTLADRYLPDVAGALLRSSVCLYTNIPDQHFVIDRHPAHANVTVVSACSGHGFKFAPALGELVADLVMEREPRVSLAPFSLQRFTR